MIFLPSITTTKDNFWERIGEIDKLGLKTIGLFLTNTSEAERKKIYAELKKTGLERVNLVHLKNDMGEDCIEELIKILGVEKFNIHHPNADYFPYKFPVPKYRKIIYIENTTPSIDDVVESWAGMCLDTAHAESQKLMGKEIFKDFDRAMKSYHVGVAHISAIAKAPIRDRLYGEHWDRHWFDDLDELDYVMNYLPYLPEVSNFELENSLREQLEAKKYLEEKLKKFLKSN